MTCVCGHDEYMHHWMNTDTNKPIPFEVMSECFAGLLAEKRCGCKKYEELKELLGKEK